LFFIWPEDKELENVENELGEIENVNSLEVLDIRRAL
jgi:translation elongation factor EF-1beta